MCLPIYDENTRCVGVIQVYCFVNVWQLIKGLMKKMNLKKKTNITSDKQLHKLEQIFSMQGSLKELLVGHKDNVSNITPLC